MTKAEKQEKNEESKSSVKDGGLYMIVIDDSQDFACVIENAAKVAQKRNGHVYILSVIEEPGFLHWGAIEKEIKDNQRSEVETRLWEAATQINEFNGHIPAFDIREGKKRETILDVLQTNDDIRMLILGIAKGTANPIISHFSSSGLSDLRVPLMLVPDMRD